MRHTSYKSTLLLVILISLVCLFTACRCTLGDSFTAIKFEIENQHTSTIQIIVQHSFRPNPEDLRDTLSLVPSSFLVLDTKMPITSCGDNARETLDNIELSFLALSINEDTGKSYRKNPLLIDNWDKQYFNEDSSKVRLVILEKDFE